MHILIVEDNELNRDMLQRRLARYGFEVTFGCDGEEGVRLARAEKPDLILLDLGLPVLDGWDVIHQLKTSGDTQRIPIIVLTGHALVEHENRARALGCVDFITKPIDMPRLLAAIHKQESPGA